MKKTSFVLLSFIFGIAFSVFPEDAIEPILTQGLKTLELKLSKPIVVSLGNFVYADKNIGSAFGSFLEQKIAFILSGSGKIKFFAKNKLVDILESLELSVSDLVNPATAPKIGMLEGVEALLYGTYYDKGSSVALYLDLVKIESGISIAKIEIDIPKSGIPPTLSVLPDNYNDALYVLDQLSDVTGSGNGDFTVKLWTSRGNGATFKDGEELVVNFFSSADCYIKIYHIGVDGKASIIFPNKYYADNFIRKKVIYKIPDEKYPFTFTLGAPFGTEFVKVIASNVQFAEIETAFEDIGKASKKLITKGLSVQGKTTRTAEAIISYTILKK
jgi:hypothetical protein